MAKTKFIVGDWIILVPRAPRRLDHLRQSLGRILAVRDTSPKYEAIWYPPLDIACETSWLYSGHRNFWTIEMAGYLCPAPQETLENPQLLYAIMSESLASGLAKVDSICDIPDTEGQDLARYQVLDGTKRSSGSLATDSHISCR